MATSNDSVAMETEDHPMLWYKQEVHRLRHLCQTLSEDNRRKDDQIQYLSSALRDATLKLNERDVAVMNAIRDRRTEALDRYRSDYEREHPFQTDYSGAPSVGVHAGGGGGYDEIDSLPEQSRPDLSSLTEQSRPNLDLVPEQSKPDLVQSAEPKVKPT